MGEGSAHHETDDADHADNVDRADRTLRGPMEEGESDQGIDVLPLIACCG